MKRIGGDFEMHSKAKKGVSGLLILGVFAAVVCVAALVVMANVNENAKTGTELNKLQIAQIKKQAVTDIGTGVSGKVGLFSYSDIKPLVNFKFEDLTGTARNPTLYLYTTDPKTMVGGEFWGNERSWADNADEYWSSSTASSGQVQKAIAPGTKVYGHASLSSYEDVFFEYTVPTTGDVSPGDAVDTNAGLTANTWTMAAYDTTALASSIDLGHAGTNATNTELAKSITSNFVADNKKVCLSEIRLTNVQKYSDLGIRKLQIDVQGQALLIYDYNGGTDRTKYESATNGQTYDSDDYEAHRTFLNSVCYNENEIPNIQVHEWADTKDAAYAGYLNNGNTTATITINDREGTALVSAVAITA